MLLKNAKVFSSDCQFHVQNISISGKYIINPLQNESNTEKSDVELDLEGCFLIPGLIDTHLHGALGADFSDANADTIKIMAEYELQHGITSFLPATMTLPEDDLINICATSAKYVQEEQFSTSKMSSFLGIYMEGPFFSREKCGAQNPGYLKNPDYELFLRLQKASDGKIRVCSLAPELPGATNFIHACQKQPFTDHKLSIALGHTIATEQDAKAALLAGADRITHFYNGMLHYEDIEKAVLTRENCFVELICDGKHNSKERIYHAFEAFGAEKILLISDSMRATGMPDGIYTLGGQEVTVSGKDAMLSSGARAGSVCNLYDCFLTCVKLGIPLEQAVRAVTVNPAKSLHIEDSIGSIAYGLHADLLILNRDLEILHVIKNGQII